MSKFIKLTNLIININYIQTIVIKPNKYYINVMTNKFDGSNWSSPVIGIGTISSYNSEIEVCETQNSSDYKIVSEWIDNH
jgi:RecB family endonuclease NucS